MPSPAFFPPPSAVNHQLVFFPPQTSKKRAASLARLRFTGCQPGSPQKPFPTSKREASRCLPQRAAEPTAEGAGTAPRPRGPTAAIYTPRFLQAAGGDERGAANTPCSGASRTDTGGGTLWPRVKRDRGEPSPWRETRHAPALLHSLFQRSHSHFGHSSERFFGSCCVVCFFLLSPLSPPSIIL